jgi:signal transduction histidine kinase
MSHLAPRFRPAAAVGNVLTSALIAVTWGAFTVALLLSGVSSLFALGLGAVVLVAWIACMRVAVDLERRRAAGVHGLHLLVPPRRRSLRTGLGRVLHDLWLDITSGWFWRGVAHHHLKMLLGLVGSALAAAGLSVLVIGLFRLFGAGAAENLAGSGTDVLGALSTPVLSGLMATGLVVGVGGLLGAGWLDRQLDRAMLPATDSELMRQQIRQLDARTQVLSRQRQELSEQRQGAVDAADLERRRIERDLHDGAQPRLVHLAMILGMARSKIGTDPDAATALVTEAHAEAKEIMTELRQLTRGIHPAVLTDRGLDAALSAVVGRSPVPVSTSVLLPGRLAPEVEAVAYFVVTEALTNIAKHSGANRAAVRIDLDPAVPAGTPLAAIAGRLSVQICDDGHGGAVVDAGANHTGLRGLAERVRAAGGTFAVDSPSDGPTVLTAHLPVAPGSVRPIPHHSPEVTP